MKNNELNIWILLDSSSIGGIESHVFQLSHGLKKSNINVEVVFIKEYKNNPLIKKLKNSHIRYSFLRYGLISLMCRIYRQQPNIIHTHGYKAGIFGRIAGYLLNTPCVSTYHAGEKPLGKVGLYDWIDRKTAPLAKKVICVSQKVADRINTKSIVLNNFIHTSNLSISKGNNIAFVGRLSHEKGPDVYLQIAQQHKEHYFHIYGDGPLLTSLKNNNSSNVIFHGSKSSMDSEWNNIGALIITSRYEGLPMAAIEAMGRGIPVIAFNVGALNTLIKNHINGWITEKNNYSELSKHIENWTKLSEERKENIKINAQQTINQYFSHTAVIPIYIKMYQKIVTESRKKNKNFIKDNLTAQGAPHEYK